MRVIPCVARAHTTSTTCGALRVTIAMMLCVALAVCAVASVWDARVNPDFVAQLFRRIHRLI